MDSGIAYCPSASLHSESQSLYSTNWWTAFNENGVCLWILERGAQVSYYIDLQVNERHREQVASQISVQGRIGGAHILARRAA